MREKTVLLSNLQLKDINPVQCGWQQCHSGYAYGPAVRNHYLLHYVVSGKGEYHNSDQSYAIKKGDIFVIRPGENTFYKADEETPWEYIWIGFDCAESFPRFLKEDVIALPVAQGLFNAMISSTELEHGRELFLCGKLYELFAMLSGRNRLAYNKNDSIQQAITYLETEFMKDISISQLAKDLNMDRSHFSVLFKAAAGVSPQQYLTRLRMEKACELMQNHGFSVGEAASAVGYADVYTFSRLFKMKYGAAPTVYMKNKL